MRAQGTTLKLLSLAEIADFVSLSRGACSKAAVHQAIRRHRLAPAGKSPRGHAAYDAATAVYIRDHLRQPNVKRAR